MNSLARMITWLRGGGGVLAIEGSFAWCLAIVAIFDGLGRANS